MLRVSAGVALALLLPQAFGLASLVLAFLTHQCGHLVRERRMLHDELGLTV